MIKSNTKKGTRVVVIGDSKSSGRTGTVLNPKVKSWYVLGEIYSDKASIRLDATSDKPACNITILRKNVEAV